MEETKKKLYVERDGFCAEASMLFMGLAMVFRLIGSIGRWGDMQYLITQVALPIFGGLLFLLFVIVAGKKAFWATVIPVLLGAAYFVFQAMEVENELYRVGFIFFYLVIAVMYALAFSQTWMKWILAAVLTLTFLFHVVVLDIPKLTDAAHQVMFLDGMQEMSVLAVILSMLFITLAMRTAEKPVKKKAEKTKKKEETPPAEEKPEKAPVEEEKPAVKPAEPAPLPAEPAPKPAEPAPLPAESAPTPASEEPDPTPAPEESEPAEPEIVEIPTLELRPGAEPAPAYPMEEPSAETAAPSEGDGAENP